MNDTPTFGVMLRAARLRFVYVSRLNCFMRVSDAGVNFLVEIRPNDVNLLGNGKSRLYRQIEDPESVIKLSPVLSRLKSVSKPIDLFLDDDGNEAISHSH